jgi:hypothetical protein
MESPPINLARLAEILGVVEIEKVPLSMRGRCMAAGRGVRVELSDSLAPFEADLTLAHELAHLILGDMRGTGQSVRRLPFAADISYSELEQICDSCADEILLGDDWLRERIDGLQPSLRQAQALSDLCGYPPEYIARRAIGSQLWRARLIWFDWDGRAFNPKVTYPFKDELYLLDILPLTTDLPAGGVIASGSLELMKGEGPFQADLCRTRSDQLLVMMTFAPDPIASS